MVHAEGMHNRVLEDKQEFVGQTRQRRTLQTEEIIWVMTWKNEIT